MARFWTALVFALALAAATNTALGGGKEKPKFKELKFEGMIAKDDPKDRVRNTPCQIHVVTLKGGLGYTIDMAGAGFDAYLRLEDPAGKELAEDDDSGGNLNAQIVYNCTKDGDYRVVATTFGPDAGGKYTLT